MEFQMEFKVERKKWREKSGERKVEREKWRETQARGPLLS